VRAFRKINRNDRASGRRDARRLGRAGSEHGTNGADSERSGVCPGSHLRTLVDSSAIMSKREVIVHDYIDGDVPVLERMASRPRAGYRTYGLARPVGKGDAITETVSDMST
jgi:hypothetical protein